MTNRDPSHLKTPEVQAKILATRSTPEYKARQSEIMKASWAKRKAEGALFRIPINSLSNPKIERKVFAALEEWFDEQKKCYHHGWSDDRVAQVCECSPEFVKSIRRRAFGELSNQTTITYVQAEIVKLGREFDDRVLELAGDFSRRLEKFRLMLEALPK